MKKSKVTYDRLLFVLFAVTIGLFIHSCRKEQGKTNEVSLSQIDVSKYKSIFDQGINAKSSKIQNSFDQTVAPKIISNKNILWSEFKKRTLPDSTVITEFAVKDDSTLLTTEKLTVGDKVNYRNKTEAVFIEYSNGVTVYFFMKVIENLVGSNLKTNLKNLQYQVIPGNFSGEIFYYTFNDKYINGYRYLNGKASDRLSPTQNNNTTGVESTDIKKKVLTSYVCQTVTIYNEYCEWGGTVDNPYEFFHGCTETVVGTYDVICDDTAGSGTIGGSSGGSPGITPPGGTTDPGDCLTAIRNAVNSTKSKKAFDVTQPIGDLPCGTAVNSVYFGTNTAYLCGYYDSLQTGDSFTGTVEGLGVTVVINNEMIIPVLIQSSCWTIPSSYVPTGQPGKTAASEIFSSAYNNAISILYEGLMEGSITPNSVIIRQFLINQIQSDLRLVVKGASFTGQACSGIYPISKASFCSQP